MEPAARHDAIVTLLRGEACCGLVSMAQVVQAALYAPSLGYYVCDRLRVGKAFGTDFTTAAMLGPVFGRLIAAAAKTLVGNLHAYSLVEVGAEPGQTHFSSVAGEFAESLSFRFGEAVEMPKRSVLVANELLDAQPFHRFVYQGGAWRELGVRVDRAALAIEVLPDFSTPTAAEFVGSLPLAEEGWIMDAPLAAEDLLAKLLSGAWSGAVILFDYGKTIVNCLETSPAGTARAYRRHQMSGSILENLGSQDITCHVLWDRMESILNRARFQGVRLDRQEAFFVRLAATEMERITRMGHPDEMGCLRALTHPAHFGAKFQVLYGVR